MAPRVVGFARDSIVPEELPVVVYAARALAQMRPRYVDTVRIFTARVRFRLTLVDVTTPAGLVGVALVADVAMTAERAGNIETVSIVAAAMGFCRALIDIAAFIVGCRSAIEVPSWRRVRHTLSQFTNVIRVGLLAIVVLRSFGVLRVGWVIEMPHLFLVIHPRGVHK